MGLITKVKFWESVSGKNQRDADLIQGHPWVVQTWKMGNSCSETGVTLLVVGCVFDGTNIDGDFLGVGQLAASFTIAFRDADGAGKVIAYTCAD